MKYIKGDLIKLAKAGEFDVIVHGCNCLCAMGKGIAKTIKKEFPAAWRADAATKRGDKDKLGTYSLAYENINGKELIVVNAYTQFDYRGAKGVDLFEYEAFNKILRNLAKEFEGKKFGLPLIGCGLAGGNKEVIMKSIEDNLAKTQDVTIVEFEP